MQACRLLPVLPPRRRHRTVMENFKILGTCTVPSHGTLPTQLDRNLHFPCLLRTNSNGFP